MKVAFICLGCAKNLVNAEQMMALVRQAGHTLTARPEEADAAVVSNHPPNLKAAACRFGALCTVTATPGQRYPPRLVSSSN